MNQLGAKLVFEGGDLFADGRLTDATFFRDSREATLFDHPDEHLHCVEFVHTNLPIPLWNGLYFWGIGFTRLFSDDPPQDSFFVQARFIPTWNGWYSRNCHIDLPRLHIR